MSPEKTEPRYWDKIYRDAGKPKTLTPKIVKLLAKFIPVPKSNLEARIHQIASDENIRIMLEAGCGEGRYVFPLAHSVSLSVGIDFSREAIYKAMEHKTFMPAKDNIFLCLADVGNLPFADNTFDLILSLGVIEHFRNPSPLLGEMRRVLKSDGLLFLEVPNRKGFGRTKKWIEMSRRKFGYHDYYTCGELSVITSKAGLKVKKAYFMDFAWGVSIWYGSYIKIAYLSNKGILKYINIAIARMLYWLSCPLNRVMKDRGFYSIVEASK